MEPWTELATTNVPGEASAMRLLRQGNAFSIMVGRHELMTSEDRGSERVLATLPCARLQDRPGARILIGGLGMGFTLRAALEILGPDAQVIVSELVPAVADWARGPMAPLFGASLDDPRVEVRIQDVGRTIQSGPGLFDAILLDVDNGPQPLTKRSNAKLYDIWGLKRARYALKPNGILAVWSGAPDRRFKARLNLAGFAVEELRVHAAGTTGRRHVLWLGTRSAEDPWGEIAARFPALPRATAPAA